MTANCTSKTTNNDAGADYPQLRKQYFDQSKSLKLRPNQVISGWREAMMLMHVGDRWQIYVPPELGYKDERVRVFDLQILRLINTSWDISAAKRKVDAAKVSSHLQALSRSTRL